MGSEPRQPGAVTAAFMHVVKHEADAREWKPAELARRAGVNPNSLGTWLRGERMPTPEQVWQLSDALDIPLSELIRRAVG